MSRIELSREERWEWLRKTCWGKSIIPWVNQNKDE
jgi:hypothetical protein